jgi:hypothetical protein
VAVATFHLEVLVHIPSNSEVHFRPGVVACVPSGWR